MTTDAPGLPTQAGPSIGGGPAKKDVDVDGHDLPPSPASSTPRPGRRYALATELVFTEHNDQFNSTSMPIYQVGKHTR
jgi:cysteine-S-conjugate beta-lyase